MPGVLPTSDALPIFVKADTVLLLKFQVSLQRVMILCILTKFN